MPSVLQNLIQRYARATSGRQGDIGHRIKEREYWDRSLKYSQRTVWAAVASAFFAFMAVFGVAAQALIARNTLYSSERPWIRVDVSIIGPVRIAENSVAATVQFAFINKGRTPAFSTMPFYGFVMNDRRNAFHDAQQPYVGGEKAGATVFPDQKIEIQEVMTQQLADFTPLKETHEAEKLTLGISGCVTYQDQALDHHKTCFAYDFRSGDRIGIPFKSAIVPEVQLSAHLYTAGLFEAD